MKTSSGCGSLVFVAVVVVLIVLVLAFFGSQGGGSHPSAGSEDAILMAEVFVKKDLVAPLTAKFSEEKFERLDDGSYIVSGQVDSQNSFGAMLRTDWCYKIRPLAGDKWHLVSDNSRAELYSHDHNGDQASNSASTPVPPDESTPVPQEQPSSTPAVTPEPTPRPLPREITLIAPVQIPAVFGEKSFGTVTLPRGTRLTLVSLNNGVVTVRYAGSTATVPVTVTDLPLR